MNYMKKFVVMSSYDKDRMYVKPKLNMFKKKRKVLMSALELKRTGKNLLYVEKEVKQKENLKAASYTNYVTLSVIYILRASSERTKSTQGLSIQKYHQQRYCFMGLLPSSDKEK